MKIIKAYTDAVAMGNQGYGMGAGASAEDAKAKGRQQTPPKQGGDLVRLSAEAMRALETGGESLSVCAQDATYDQYGNLTRQVDALQRDISNLAMMNFPAGAGMSAKLNSLRAQVNGLRAQV